MFGDMNSRCAALQDFVDCDDFLCELQGNFGLSEESAEIVSCFEKANVRRSRSTADHVTNVYGPQLIDFCKNNNIFILNGRISPDSDSPKRTCKNSSTVDYFLCTAHVFEFVSNLEIQEYSCLYSDAHCPISLAINIRDVSLNASMINEGTSKPKVKLWNECNAEAYLENFEYSKVNEISEYLNSLLSKNINCEDINYAVTQKGNLFVSNAEKSFGFQKQFTAKITHQNKPWFDSDCHKARNSYHNARKLYNKHKTQYYKNILKTVSKAYKRTISTSVKKHKNIKVQKIKQLKSKKPRDFWKIINSVDKKETTLAPLEKLHDFFRSINDPPDTGESNECNYGE